MTEAQASNAPYPQPGQLFAQRYRVTKAVGGGAISDLFAAEALEGGARVALKVLRRDFASDPRAVSAFIEGGRRAASLVHPNIARTYEALQNETGIPFIVSELLEGVPLSAYTQNGGRVGPAQATLVMQGVLAGLAAAHAQGVVHRDLKPQNIFLTRDSGGQFVVKVLDFGIGDAFYALGGSGQRAANGTLLGSPAYLAPEQVRNEAPDARTDLWAAGVVFYEMVTGKMAFAAPTEYARLGAVLNATPESPDKVDLELTFLNAFVARALEKDRSRRFQTAHEMASTLARAGGAPSGEGVRSPSPLSRLPDVAPAFAPSIAYPRPSATLESTYPSVAPPVTNAAPGPSVAATLSSSAAPAAGLDAPAIPTASAADASHEHVGGETLPSNDLPMLPATSRGAPRMGGGVAPRTVLLLVAVALAIGVAIGYLLGHGSPT